MFIGHFVVKPARKLTEPSGKLHLLMRMLPIVVVVSAARAAIIATAPASRVATPPLERIREGVATTIESGSRIWDSGRALHAYLAVGYEVVP